MQRHLKSLDHETSAPPAKLKNVRKKLDAAKAIDNPKTIWISRRKPPLVSPKASESPVTMMTITAMILATGPCTESRIDCRGASHGMFEPAACADRLNGPQMSAAATATAKVRGLTENRFVVIYASPSSREMGSRR